MSIAIALCLLVVGCSNSKDEFLRRQTTSTEEGSTGSVNNNAVIEQVPGDQTSGESPDMSKTVASVELSGTQTEVTRDLLIARHFVGVMAQLPELEPESTLLVLSPRMRRNDMVKAFHRAAAEVGYAVRYDWDVEKGEAVRVLQERDRDSEGRFDVYELSVGAVEFRRAFYTNDEMGVRARGPLYVRGADASNISVDHTLSE